MSSGNRILLSFLIISKSMLFAQMKPEILSQELLKAVKIELPTDSIKNQLAHLSPTDFEKMLSSHEEKMAFWLNIYNATSQFALKEKPEIFKTKKTRSKFYKMKLINVAGHLLSLDEIEHGILRRGKNKFSLGYLPRIFQRKFIRKSEVDRLDPRIHFSLNCGATSCPPILFYESKNLNDQLNQSTRGYLDGACLKTEKNIEVPALFSWFRGDFGGKKGIYNFLESYNIIQKGERKKLKYLPYDWTLALGNYE